MRASAIAPAPFAADLARLDIDPARTGWRRGTLEAPCHGTGRGRRNLPLVGVRGGNGPGVLLVCTDGDPAIVAALAALALELSPDDLPGGCVVVPDASGLAREARDAFDALLVARAALVVELGSGGGAGEPELDWSSTAIVHPRAGRRRADASAEAAMVAFGARESLRLHGLAPWCGMPACERPDIDVGAAREPTDTASRTPALAARAARLDVPHVEVRCGRGDAREILSTVRTGCRNVLVDAGVLTASRELCATRHLELGAASGVAIGTTVRAGAHGELRMDARPGEDVYAGTVLARLLDPERPRARPTEMLAPCDGVLLARRPDGSLRPGETIALVAEPMQP